MADTLFLIAIWPLNKQGKANEDAGRSRQFDRSSGTMADLGQHDLDYGRFAHA
ncbi:hypothetical protein ACFIOY_00350 [Bradyrhizobium sp. TZ2]